MKNKLNSRKWHKILCIGITALLSAVILTGYNNDSNSYDETKSKRIPIKI